MTTFAVFAVATASAALKRIIKLESEINGPCRGWQPTAEGGAVLFFDALERLITCSDIENMIF